MNTVREEGWQQSAERSSLSAAPRLWSLLGRTGDLLFGQSVVVFVGDQPQCSLVCVLWRPQQL